jgi:hypothetical protein
VTTLKFQRLVDCGQDAVGCMRGPSDIRVGQDGKKLWRRAAQDSWRVHISYCARERCGHRLQGVLRLTAGVGLDKKHAEISLIPVGARELVLEHGPYKAIVEEAGRPIDDVQGLSLGIISPHATRRAEDCAVGQGRPASQACLSFRPAA